VFEESESESGYRKRTGNTMAKRTGNTMAKRTGNTMAKRKGTNGQTTIYKAYT
jgi:hypothetical protein